MIKNNQYTLGLYEKAMPNDLTIFEKLKAAKSAGFDFMEISIDETDEKLLRLEWSDKEKQSVINDMFNAGIRIETMCLSGHRKYPLGSEDIEIRTCGVEIMRQAIDLAACVGIRIIQIAGYDEYYNPTTINTVRNFAENLRKSVDYAALKGVILAFETMETKFMNTVFKAMMHVREINSPYLQIYPDLGNITNAALQYDYCILSDIDSGRGHIAAMHLKETLPGKFREIPYGTGHVNFSEAIQAAYKMGVRRYVGEFWYTGNRDWREQLIFANKFLRKAFIKAIGE